jgi:hypothetical protein
MKIPLTKESVIDIATALLEGCEWSLELEANELVSIPKNANLVVASRAYIEEDIEGYTWGNHYQARVLIEPSNDGVPKYGTLGLYINTDGKLITHDHGHHI